MISRQLMIFFLMFFFFHAAFSLWFRFFAAMPDLPLLPRHAAPRLLAAATPRHASADVADVAPQARYAAMMLQDDAALPMLAPLKAPY